MLTSRPPFQILMAGTNDMLASEYPENMFLQYVRCLLKRARVKDPAASPLTGFDFCAIVRQDDVGAATSLCLQAGVPVNSICAKSGHTALGVTCFRGFPQTAKILVAAKADVNSFFGRATAMLAWVGCPSKLQRPVPRYSQQRSSAEPFRP
jgi:hypothetical protein